MNSRTRAYSLLFWMVCLACLGPGAGVCALAAAPVAGEPKIADVARRAAGDEAASPVPLDPRMAAIQQAWEARELRFEKFDVRWTENHIHPNREADFAPAGTTYPFQNRVAGDGKKFLFFGEGKLINPFPMAIHDGYQRGVFNGQEWRVLEKKSSSNTRMQARVTRQSSGFSFWHAQCCIPVWWWFRPIQSPFAPLTSYHVMSDIAIMDGRKCLILSTGERPSYRQELTISNDPQALLLKYQELDPDGLNRQTKWEYAEGPAGPELKSWSRSNRSLVHYDSVIEGDVKVELHPEFSPTEFELQFPAGTLVTHLYPEDDRPPPGTLMPSAKAKKQGYPAYLVMSDGSYHLLTEKDRRLGKSYVEIVHAIESGAPGIADPTPRTIPRFLTWGLGALLGLTITILVVIWHRRRDPSSSTVIHSDSPCPIGGADPPVCEGE